ncbi:deoxynucleoside kinase isoform X1 [Neodiprion fabricii]|uniref:deoxynucleoside kinase isoform X1 n=2 Tax=Neodiprion fabricii TaxID=2872261 RepID=UPI001ED94947|nr:deoxynucleoside kinase isoform X1 [Neodiprion fabricii]
MRNHATCQNFDGRKRCKVPPPSIAEYLRGNVYASTALLVSLLAGKLFARMSTSPNKNCKRLFTVCIEGNIGSGKTTFLNNFKANDNMLVLQEPVELWRDVGGTNLLEKMYKDPVRYGCLFQSYVQLTMLQLHTQKTNLPFKVMERSVYSARCFIENMKRTKMLEKVEIDILEQWHEWCIQCADIQTDLIVYLRTSPEVVYERMRTRARKEEDCVSLEYLRQVHDVHDDWLYNRSLFSVPAPVMVLDANKSVSEMMAEFEKCRRSIFENRDKLIMENKNMQKRRNVEPMSPLSPTKISVGSV